MLNKLRRPVLLMLLLATITTIPETALAQWGHLKGQVVYEGNIPKVDVLVKGAVGKGDILSEELVIDPKTKGIANCVIYLSRKPAKIHPALAKPKKKTVDVEIVKGTYKPHVLIVHKDQSVKVTNNDARNHNVKTNMIRTPATNANLNPKGFAQFNFRAAEFLPMKVECNIHPWMNAYWYVVDHPYAAVTDKEGKFEIKNLPVGKHTFKVWQEKAGYLERSLVIEILDGKTREADMTAFPDQFK